MYDDDNSSFSDNDLFVTEQTEYPSSNQNPNQIDNSFWGNIDDLVTALSPVIFLLIGLLTILPVVFFDNESYKDVAIPFASGCLGVASGRRKQ